jgi:hypothetical protein
MIAWLAMMLAAAQPASGGLFARQATGVADIAGSPRPKTVTAPNGRSRAVARFSDWSTDDSDDHLTVFLGGDDHRFPAGPNAELLWSPDSAALAVTADEGGAAGSYALTILVKKEKGRHWREVEVTEKVVRLFTPHMRCDDDETPNVAALGWISGQRLLVMAQVPPHSSCRNMGRYAGYIVDTVTGEPLMDVSSKLLRTRYRAMLGRNFAAPTRHRHRSEHHRR